MSDYTISKKCGYSHFAPFNGLSGIKIGIFDCKAVYRACASKLRKHPLGAQEGSLNMLCFFDELLFEALAVFFRESQKQGFTRSKRHWIFSLMIFYLKKENAQ
ncbi:MAG: hypothetical protein LBU32_15140 [Clostridiales bacterium]|nr:hypothetical protein [Clostridiales bacterium]